MKTTIEVPDDLARRAKIAAAERRTTLKELVVQGLERVLAESPASPRERARKLFEEMDKLPEFAASDRLSRIDSHAR